MGPIWPTLDRAAPEQKTQKANHVSDQTEKCGDILSTHHCIILLPSSHSHIPTHICLKVN